MQKFKILFDDTFAQLTHLEVQSVIENQRSSHIIYLFVVITPTKS